MATPPMATGLPQITPPDMGTIDGLLAAGARIAGLALLAGLIGAIVAFGYRWYVRESIPDGIAILVGVSTVAIYVNTIGAFGAVLEGDPKLLEPETAVFTLVAIGAGGVLADVGRRIGDRIGQTSGRVTALRDLGEMGRVVRSRGKVVTVEIPEDPGAIADIDGYDPVGQPVKEALAGRSLVFPRGVTVAELRDRLIQRLTEDYDVGHVDVELDADGTVTYIAVGRRAAGIGTTLPPGTEAVAVRADPAFSASPGDIVQVWVGGEDPERVTTAEFRGATDDVVTLALDGPDARTLDPTQEYRLVTMPGQPAIEREFAGLLRAADETMEAVTISAGSTLVGVPVSALAVTVVAVMADDGIEAIPRRSRVLAPGETVYAVARPEALRRFQAAADPDNPAPAATDTAW